MNKLEINTSSDPARVSIMREDEEIASRQLPVDRNLGKNLVKAIDDILAEVKMGLSEVDQVVSHDGPGKRQMALRTGTVTAEILTFAIDSVKKT